MHVSVGYRTLKEFSHDLPNMLFSRERAYVNGMQGCIHDKLGYRVSHAKLMRLWLNKYSLSPHSHADRAGKGPQMIGQDIQ